MSTSYRHEPVVYPAKIYDSPGLLDDDWKIKFKGTLDTERLNPLAKCHHLMAELHFLEERYHSMVSNYNHLCNGIIGVIDAHEECTGCADGKAEAAEEIGLVWRPEQEFSVSFDVTLNESDREDLEGKVDALLAEYGSSTAWNVA